MFTILILRDLWRLRVVVALIAALGIFISLVVLFRVSPSGLESRRYEVGVADVRVLVDTPTSQVVDVAPKGSDTLGARTGLLASLMVDGVLQSDIARRAGLRPHQLHGVAQSGSPNPTESAAPPDPRGNVLKTRVLANERGDLLPIIEIEAQAADAEDAAKLANAAVIGLSSYLEQQAVQGAVPAGRRLRVSGLGRAQAGIVVRGPSLMVATLLGFAVFGLGCAALLGVNALARDWRTVSREEHSRSQPGAGDKPAASTEPVARKPVTPPSPEPAARPSVAVEAYGYDWSSPPRAS